MAEGSSFFLEEALADAIAELCLAQQGVSAVEVRVEKPNALRFAKTVAVEIVRERERGTIEQLIVTPIRNWELIVGKILPYVILAFVDVIEVLVIGHWWFQVPVRGDLGLILLLSGLFVLSSLGIGLFASTIANTQQEAVLTVLNTAAIHAAYFNPRSAQIILASQQILFLKAAT